MLLGVLNQTKHNIAIQSLQKIVEWTNKLTQMDIFLQL